MGFECCSRYFLKQCDKYLLEWEEFFHLDYLDGDIPNDQAVRTAITIISVVQEKNP